jgi:hypothetical protein
MAVPHLLAQSLQSAELELLDGALGFAQALRDFLDTAFLDEAFANDAALNFRELFDKTEEKGVAFDEFHFLRGDVGWSGWVEGVVVSLLLAVGALVVIGDGVGSDAEEPGSEGGAAPFVRWKFGESFVKDVGRKILCGGTIVDAANCKKVDPLEMKLIKSVEFRRVGLRGFDEQTLVGRLRRRLSCRSSCGHHGDVIVTGGEWKGYGAICSNSLITVPTVGIERAQNAGFPYFGVTDCRLASGAGGE